MFNKIISQFLQLKDIKYVHPSIEETRSIIENAPAFWSYWFDITNMTKGITGSRFYI